ncbi:hypothetical protein [Desulfamplus magnetovallimortis]|nr:hypothetical protein [Desulfamplus magnetovallimortis]
MPTTVLDNIKGKDIPLPWLQKSKESPETNFTIILKVKPEIKNKPSKKQNKWEQLAQEMENIDFMDNGVGDYFLKQSKEFREDFHFKNDNEV